MGGQHIETEIVERIWHDTAPHGDYTDNLAPMDFALMEYEFAVGQELICYWAKPDLAHRFIIQVGKLKWHVRAGRPLEIGRVEIA